ncbi:MAG: hypothetical protein ABH816_00510 [Candidatus Levyibacteriota bacterium]
MRKIFCLFLSAAIFLPLFLSFTQKALAVCPVCTVAVIGGVGLSRWFGIDDTITGLWIGGLTVSMIMWTISFLDSRKIVFKGRKIITTLGYYLLIVLPLYKTDIMGHPYNRIWGMDKLLIGIIFGSIFFFMGGIWYFKMKEKNDGRAHFPFQKALMPVIPLVILSIIFWFITKK